KKKKIGEGSINKKKKKKKVFVPFCRFEIMFDNNPVNREAYDWLALSVLVHETLLIPRFWFLYYDWQLGKDLNKLAWKQQLYLGRLRVREMGKDDVAQNRQPLFIPSHNSTSLGLNPTRSNTNTTAIAIATANTSKNFEIATSIELEPKSEIEPEPEPEPEPKTEVEINVDVDVVEVEVEAGLNALEKENVIAISEIPSPSELPPLSLLVATTMTMTLETATADTYHSARHGKVLARPDASSIRCSSSGSGSSGVGESENGSDTTRWTLRYRKYLGNTRFMLFVLALYFITFLGVAAILQFFVDYHDTSVLASLYASFTSIVILVCGSKITRCHDLFEIQSYYYYLYIQK
ncbi:hypothetical protein RFI_18296, partial [Reticulomyxa filosa]